MTVCNHYITLFTGKTSIYNHMNTHNYALSKHVSLQEFYVSISVYIHICPPKNNKYVVFQH